MLSPWTLQWNKTITWLAMKVNFLTNRRSISVGWAVWFIWQLKIRTQLFCAHAFSVLASSTIEALSSRITCHTLLEEGTWARIYAKLKQISLFIGLLWLGLAKYPLTRCSLTSIVLVISYLRGRWKSSRQSRTSLQKQSTGQWLWRLWKSSGQKQFFTLFVSCRTSQYLCSVTIKQDYT